MPTANLKLEIPTGAWIHDVSTSHAEATFRILAVHSSGSTGVVLLEIESRAVNSILSAVEDHDEVITFEQIGTGDHRTLIQVETGNPRLLTAAHSAGVPIKTPFEVNDGRAHWEVTTSSDRLSSLKDRLSADGIDYGLTSVLHLATDFTGHLLTDRQREVLLSAHDSGYYETPRRSTLTEVAASLDISKATASNILHRAEGQIIDWVIGELLVD